MSEWSDEAIALELLLANTRRCKLDPKSGTFNQGAKQLAQSIDEEPGFVREFLYAALIGNEKAVRNVPIALSGRVAWSIVKRYLTYSRKPLANLKRDLGNQAALTGIPRERLQEWIRGALTEVLDDIFWSRRNRQKT